jgi:hypothetical protein
LAKDVLLCPHCGIHSTISLRTSFGSHYIYTCDRCDKLTLLVIENREVTDQYPKRVPKIDSSIPQDAANDYVEAIKCFDVGANKASVAMCRRALQASLIQKGAGKGKLVDQIDELFDKGIITEDIKNWAHEIRLTGNVGAHPDQDGLGNVTPQDAEELIKFIEEYLNYVYIMPAKVAEKRARKTK